MRAHNRIAIAQINTTVGDIAGNAQKIMEYYNKASAKGADMVVFPELCLIGYPPEDVVLTPSFRQEAMHTAQGLAAQTMGGATMIIGCPWDRGGQVLNAALLLDNGAVSHIQSKTHLPNYGIFDEKRLFGAGDGPKVFNWRGIKVGMLICEDMWYPQTSRDLAVAGAQMIFVINASPFEAGKLAQRKAFAMRAIEQSRVPLIYANAIGGQDDIVFDGGSFVMDGERNVLLQMEEFAEALEIFDLESPANSRIPLPTEETLWQAMVLGLRDYVRKNGFSAVTLGLSGGIDSAVSAAVAVDALGAANVTGVLLPSPYTSTDSIEDAMMTAKMLGINTLNIPITESMQVMHQVLNPVFNDEKWMENVAVGGNLQARLRGLTLMSLSNQYGWLLLSTGNKSEIAVGYTTLYGDSCGGFNVLKDAYKTQVYALANWRNKQGEVIPQRSITKAPTAELAPGQKDQDQLPPYEVLDAILAHHIEGRESAREIIARGFNADITNKVVRMVRLNEYKRRQSCPGVRLSSMMFGRDRRFPLTNKF